MDVLLLIIVGTLLWMVADAHSAGRSWGSILGWVICGALLWIVTFPIYLVSRKNFERQVNAVSH